MDKIRMAEKLIRAWRMLNVPIKSGLFGDENVFTKTADEISDALMILAGENDKDYQNTTTYAALHSIWMAPDATARSLIGEQDEPEEPGQPKPVFFTQEQIDRMQEVLGGYVYERK